jgi:hypothetical protein
MRRRSTTEGQIEVRGKSIDYTVDGDGMFSAELNGETFKTESLRQLKDKLLARAGKKPLNIPVTKVEETERWRSHSGKALLEFTDGILTGIHSANRNLIVKWDDMSRSEQVTHYGATVLRRLTEKERLVLAARHNAKVRAEDEYDELLRSLKYEQADTGEE